MRMKIASFICVCMTLLSAHAFHVHIGITYKSGEMLWEQRRGNTTIPQMPWGGNDIELGGDTPYYLNGDDVYQGGMYVGSSDVEYRCYDKSSGEWSDEMGTASLYFANKANTRQFRMFSITSAYRSDTFTLSQAGTRVNTFGWINSWVDHGIYNCLVTAKGDPYSLVVNDTGSDLTVNGIELKSGEGKKFYMPVYLTMSELSGVTFYDNDSGVQLTSTWNGAQYEIKYTGNIRIYKSHDESITCSLEPLVYGDIKTANENKLLYADNGKLIHSLPTNFLSQVNLMTEWVFDQDAWGYPQAMINGIVVCGSHSTTHIIDYNVSSDAGGSRSKQGFKYYIDFTMSQTVASGHSGGSCVYRCWDATKSTFDQADENKRASVSGGVGTVAAFRFIYDTTNDSWTLTTR